MAKEVTIQLIDPFPGHGVAVTSITIREPRASDVFQLGELQVTTRSSDGGVIYLDRDEIYEKYLERLLVPGKDGGGADVVVGQLSLADGYQVRRVINDFFDRAQVTAFERLRKPSSGPSAGSPSPTS